MTTANCPISLHKVNAVSQNTSQIFECYFTILKRKLTFRAFLRHRKAQANFQGVTLHYPNNRKPTFPFLPSLLDSEFFLVFPAELGGCSPRTTFVLKTCDFVPELARAKGESNPRPRDCESRRANHETTSKGRFASKKNARRRRALPHAQSPQRVHRAQDRFARDHSESSSTRTISAEGSPRSRQMRTAPQRERFDTHDLCRGFAAVKTNSHGATARAL